MIKIFQLVTSVNLGGAENIAFSLSENCSKANPNDFEFIVVELYHTKSKYAFEKKQELFSKKIRVITLFKGPKRLGLLFAPFKLGYHIVKEKPKAVHSHTDLPDFVLSMFLKLNFFFKLKIIRTIHNTELWTEYPKVAKFVESSFTNDTVIGVSEAALVAYQELRKKNNLTVSEYTSVIYNGCSCPSKKETPFLINKQKINIAFCGRFETQKGIDILLERILEINNLFEDQFVFHLIGNGTYREEAQKLTVTTTNVFLYDAVSNISDKLYVFDFIIMPSRFEGLVLMSIEASFARVPVIAAFAPGLDETLPVNWQLQFHLENKEELFILLKKIVNKEFELEELKEEAYSYVSKKFSLNTMIDSYSRLYDLSFENKSLKLDLKK
ncbi:glycosyltransferase family 4 protein [Flavobacterium sp. XN-5]|uniref:glycosyltransferase family 4 protein n=1 Tax=Flavobacterium sp. XN-5 TaxID=2599390 RepID=UPI0011C9F3C1|nr:glycosyltransferase family 4 protein [Flavobacterium sp. XN-5]NGY37405.1 glycosyltransferase family 4 protein [Flavobacterium sp. XN-5]